MINEIKSQITKANLAYRIGQPIMTDAEYDQLIDKLSIISPTDRILSEVGFTVTDDRKAPLPIEMSSMNKIKSMNEVNDWSRLKGISVRECVIITPKFDGLSFCVNESTGEAYTRGDGQLGQKSTEHYRLIQNHLKAEDRPFNFTYGEVIIPKQVFLDKFSQDFANPRNLVAGLLNSKTLSHSLRDCQYIKYGAVGGNIFSTKEQIINKLNEGQLTKVEYHICQISDLSEELLIGLFHKFSTQFEIDGLIIELNDLSLQNKLGRETSSNNPCWARAFKHLSFEQSAETTVTGITWNISKQGLLKPTLHLTPVTLDGVTVSNVTGNNARFVKDSGLGVGALVKIVRSGLVIPKIVEVLESVEFVMPTINGVEIDWNEAGIELITLTETDDQRLKKIISFFEILEADFVGEGVIAQLWEAGYKTISAILNLRTADLEKIDRFGRKKAQIVFDSVQKSVTGVQLSKLQHATGIFKNMGSKKLVLLEHFVKRPHIEDVIKIDGIGEILAHEYVNNYDSFFDFINDLPVTIVERVEAVKVGADLEGKSFTFTGVRRLDLESDIESRGGKIASGVSKTTTHLVMKAIGSGSSKEKKAIELGVQVITIEQLEELLN